LITYNRRKLGICQNEIWFIIVSSLKGGDTMQEKKEKKQEKKPDKKEKK